MRTVRIPTMLKVALVLLTIATVGGVTPAVAQDGKKEAAGRDVKKPGKARGRLPNYYSGVVDDAQREKIYRIQGEYAPKIAALEAQLAALRDERDETIAGVLTAEQRKKVEEAREAAAAKQRDRRKGAKQSSD